MLAVALPAAMATWGCVPVAFPMTTRIEDPAGAKKSLPAEPIVPGRTTRREIEERYRPFTVETGIPGLYWGRFRRSTWGGGLVGFPTGGARAWSVANVLVSFGPDGTARRSVDVGEKQLLTNMTEMLAESAAPASGRFQTTALEGQSADHEGPDGRPRTFAEKVEVALTESGVAVTRYRWGDWSGGDLRPETLHPTVAVASFEQIAGVRSLPDDPELDGYSKLTFTFTSKTAVGDHVTMRVTTDEMLATARWLARLRPDLAVGALEKKRNR
jgi:hypothetical protein